MPEKTTAAAATAGGDTGAAAAAAAATAPDKTLLAGGAAGAADTGAATATETAPSWREDWREALAGEDGAFLKQLERHTDPNSFARSYREMEKRRGAAAPATLPENPTPEEVSAYRKAAGIPDKPEEYGLAFSEGVEASDADKAALADFASFMHGRNVPPDAVKAAQAYYEKRMVEGRQAAAEAAEAATLESMATLRSEFKPNEITRNDNIADEFLMRFAGQDQATLAALNEWLATPLRGGVAAHNIPEIRKLLWSIGRANADDDALLAGDGRGGGTSVEAEYKALVKESVSKPKDFAPGSDKQRRLEELAGAMARRSERQRAA